MLIFVPFNGQGQKFQTRLVLKCLTDPNVCISYEQKLSDQVRTLTVKLSTRIESCEGSTRQQVLPALLDPLFIERVTKSKRAKTPHP